MPEVDMVEPRKSPKQARSRAVVEALIEATARVLVEDGYDRASTNRIAKVAGVSVGSLYQYFPNKEALVLAVVDRHLERVATLMGGLAQELADAPLEEAVTATIEALIATHQVDSDLHIALEQQVHHLAHPRFRQVRAGTTALLAGWLAARSDDIAPERAEAAAFVLHIAVKSVTHELLVDEHCVPEDVMEELTAMVLRYLRG